MVSYCSAYVSFKRHNKGSLLITLPNAQNHSVSPSIHGAFMNVLGLRDIETNPFFKPQPHVHQIRYVNFCSRFTSVSAHHGVFHPLPSNQLIIGMVQHAHQTGRSGQRPSLRIPVLATCSSPPSENGLQMDCRRNRLVTGTKPLMVIPKASVRDPSSGAISVSNLQAPISRMCSPSIIQLLPALVSQLR